MILRLLRRFVAWLREPLYDPDDALDEYWQRKWYEDDWVGSDREEDHRLDSPRNGSA